MPLIALAPPIPPDPPKTWPKIPDPPAKRILWISPDGREIPLTDGAGYTSITGRSGFGRVSPELVADATASGATRLADYRDSPRLMRIPLVIDGADPDAYLRAHRELVASTRHRRPGQVAMGAIRVELPDGSWRQIPAVYHAGLDPHEDVLDDLMWARQEHQDVEFYAPEPHFLGPPVSLAWRLAEAPRPFYPIYPLRLSSSQVGGSARIFSPGDADSYPVWEITGPGTPIMTSATTGQSWAFSEEVPEGTTVTVDCRPPSVAPETGLTAVDQDGVDWWWAFTGWPELWEIPPGEMVLSAQMTGATTASRIRLSFEPRYLSGW
ncbi:phage tail family protein [Nocardiopsis dassonvillei]|uniref:phage tail protein n=1 Tax=Nocardiopsis dassonvillei TaxID=2014 RepID=UPI00362B4791